MTNVKNLMIEEDLEKEKERLKRDRVHHEGRKQKGRIPFSK